MILILIEVMWWLFIYGHDVVVVYNVQIIMNVTAVDAITRARALMFDDYLRSSFSSQAEPSRSHHLVSLLSPSPRYPI